MQILDIDILVTAATMIGFSFYLLYLTNDKITLSLWSIALIAVQVTIAQLHWEIKWYVLLALPFYLFVLVYMMIKLRLRINAALKRIDEIEREEEKQSAQEAKAIPTATVTEDSHGE